MGKVAVVTGAGSGIGRGVAKRLAREGYMVGMLDISGEAVKLASEEISSEGHQSLALTCDVSDRLAVASCLDQIRANFGPIECMIACAGISEFVPFTELTPEVWDRMLRVNLTSMFHCIQLAIPDMIEAGWGRIITISSTSAQMGAPKMAHYVASKGGVTSLTKAIAREFGDRGITANTIPPSIVETGISAKSEERGTSPGMAVYAEQTLVKRVGIPDDIAAACSWLCGEHSGFVTGQEINVNGGWYM